MNNDVKAGVEKIVKFLREAGEETTVEKWVETAIIEKAIRDEEFRYTKYFGKLSCEKNN